MLQSSALFIIIIIIALLFILPDALIILYLVNGRVFNWDPQSFDIFLVIFDKIFDICFEKISKPTSF